MKTMFLFMVVLIVNFCYGQSKVEIYQLKDIGDTYVADVKIIQPVFAENCGCISDSKHSQCIMYEGFINIIRFIPDKSTAFDSLSLKKVKFFVLNSSQLLKPDSLYTVALSPGAAGTYLKVNSILKIDLKKKYQFIHIGPYLSGFVNCYKIGFFNKLFLKLGLVKQEDINYKNKRKQSDKFDEFINNRQ